MVNKASTPWNTRIEIAPDSITWSEPSKTYKSWFIQKERHLSVSSYYKNSSKFQLSVEPITRGLFYLSMIMAFSVGNLITIISAAVLFLIRYSTQLVIFNTSSKHFGGQKYIFSLPVFDMFLPLVSMYILTVGRIGSKGKTVKWK
jgi:hypothetical protein